MSQQTIPAAKPTEATPEPAGRSGARRAWIGNLIVIGVVAVVAIAFGRQFLNWWGRPAYSPEEQARREALSVDHRFTSPTLAFGEAPFAVEQVGLFGNRATLRAEIHRLCQTKADGSLSELSARWTSLPPAGPAEMRLLQMIARAPAIEKREGEWVMRELDGAIPLIVVLGLPADASLPGGDEKAGEPRDQSQFEPLPRVICFGVGFAGGAANAELTGQGPPAPERWSIYLCARDAFSPAMMAMAFLPDLPSDMDRTVTLPLQGNGCLCGVKGVGSADYWKKRFDAWFLEREGQRESAWEQIEGAWHARFTEPSMHIAINLAVDGNDNMSGMVAIAMRTYPQP